MTSGHGTHIVHVDALAHGTRGTVFVVGESSGLFVLCGVHSMLHRCCSYAHLCGLSFGLGRRGHKGLEACMVLHEFGIRAAGRNAAAIHEDHLVEARQVLQTVRHDHTRDVAPAAEEQTLDQDVFGVDVDGREGIVEEDGARTVPGGTCQ